MKISIVMKDTDAVLECFEDEKIKLSRQLVNDLGLSQEAATVEAESRLKKLRDLADKFFEYGEYVQIELDDEQGTARVVEVD